MNPIQFHKCLTDPTRLRCLMLIQQEQELCVCELTQALQEIQPKVSRNLATLKKSGLLLDRRQGQWVFYRIHPDLPLWANQVLKLTTENNLALIKPHLSNLQKMGSRPEREQLCCS
jgi:ArsR family transcriptional regulator, arsenate/arsenite/antimonite-responsive transcriptional repressor